MSAGVARRPPQPRPSSGSPGRGGSTRKCGGWAARRRGSGVPADDPFGRRSSSSELSQTLATLQHSVRQVRGIARTLFDYQLEDGAPRLPASLAEVLARTTIAYRTQADALDRDGTSVDAALEAVRQARQESLRSLRRVDETGAWVVSGGDTFLTDVDRMVRQLEGDTPALAVPTESPSPPSSAREALEPPHRPHLKPVRQPAAGPSGISFPYSSRRAPVPRPYRGKVGGGPVGPEARRRSPLRNVRSEPNSRRVRAARSLRAACGTWQPDSGAGGGGRRGPAGRSHAPQDPEEPGGAGVEEPRAGARGAGGDARVRVPESSGREDQFLDVLGQVPARGSRLLVAAALRALVVFLLGSVRIVQLRKAFRRHQATSNDPAAHGEP